MKLIEIVNNLKECPKMADGVIQDVFDKNLRFFRGRLPIFTSCE
ncbi:TPA: hypothetical protein ACNBW6_003882 [Escherichia coli]